MKHLNSKQRDILDYLYQNSEYTLTLTDIGGAVGIDHPQKVLDKIGQLQRAGYITKNPDGSYEVLRRFEESDQLMIPFFGYAQCGHGGKRIFEEEYPRKKLNVHKNLIHLSEQNQYFVTRARGDSMEPFIRSGDFLLVKRQNSFSPEDQVLVVHNKQPKIKKIVKDGTVWKLHSFNPEHRDMDIEDYDETNIIGTVAYKFPKNAFAI